MSAEMQAGSDHDELYVIVGRDERTGQEYIYTYKDTGKLLVTTWDECEEVLAVERAMEKIAKKGRSYRVEPLSAVETSLHRERRGLAVAAG